MAEHNEVANQATTRIVLQHHDRLVRDALAHWLVALPGYVLAGSTGSRPGLVRLCTLSRPDIVLLDVSTAQQDTMATVAGLTAVGNHHTNGASRNGSSGNNRAGPPCLIGLHGSLDVGAVARLHRAGVRRLVSYRSGLAGLRAALADAGPAHQRSPTARAGLTGREQEVLALICAGRSAAQIAVTLEISPHTVVNHTRHIFAKLDVRSRTQAAAEVARLGLLGDVAILPTNADGAIPGTPPPPGDDVRRIVASAVARGADAVLTGEGLVEQLPAVLAMVRAGYLVAPAGPVRALLAAAYPRLAPLELTKRELDILGSIRQGHSVRQTAQALGIAVKTVQSVQRQLFLRLGARNRTEALALADGLGLVDS